MARESQDLQSPLLRCPNDIFWCILDWASEDPNGAETLDALALGCKSLYERVAPRCFKELNVKGQDLTKDTEFNFPADGSKYMAIGTLRRVLERDPSLGTYCRVFRVQMGFIKEDLEHVVYIMSVLPRLQSLVLDLRRDTTQPEEFTETLLGLIGGLSCLEEGWLPDSCLDIIGKRIKSTRQPSLRKLKWSTGACQWGVAQGSAKVSCSHANRPRQTY
jgi:hypothetical protein